MPYISKFTASDGVTYDLKDSEARDYKIGKTADHSISGAAGWYKFYERQASSGTASRKHIFLIQEVYASNRSAILSFYSYRNSSGNWASPRFAIMSSSIYSKNEFAMYYSGDTISLYVNKASASSYPLAITLISSMSGISGGYVDPSEFWKSEAVTEPPSGSTYAIPCNDGAGNIIEDTYALKPPYGSITFSLSWSGSGPYTQTVTVTDATVTENSQISLQPTAAQLAQLISDGVQAITIENNAGTLTAYTLGATPSTAMTIACTVIEVAS